MPAPQHPLIVRVRKGQRRLTNAEVERLSYPALVRYCDWLLDREAALELLLDSMVPSKEHGERSTQTHCPHGHEYTPENTIQLGRARRCRECGRQAVARRSARTTASASMHPNP